MKILEVLSMLFSTALESRPESESGSCYYDAVYAGRKEVVVYALPFTLYTFGGIYIEIFVG